MHDSEFTRDEVEKPLAEALQLVTTAAVQS